MSDEAPSTLEYMHQQSISSIVKMNEKLDRPAGKAVSVFTWNMKGVQKFLKKAFACSDFIPQLQETLRRFPQWL